MPFIGPSGEQKTKPTQHSVTELRSRGIQPDVIVCRSDQPISDGLKVRNVTSANGYTRANAGITGLTAAITPPADLLGIVGTITGQGASGASAGALLGSLGGTLPVLDGAMGAVGTALGAVDALLGGATIKVASLQGSSEFAAAAQATPGPAPTVELPRTGGNGVQVAAIGAFFIALGLGFRSWLSMAAVRD